MLIQAFSSPYETPLRNVLRIATLAGMCVLCTGAKAADATTLRARVAVEDWSGAAARLKQAEWAAWLNGQRRSLDAWIAKSPERPGLIGGWIHDYVDRTSGASIKWTPDSVQPNSDGDADRTRRLQQAWVAHMRTYNVALVQVAARMYRVTGETKYADWAAGQLRLYAENYGRWPLRTQNGRGRMFQNGLDEAYQSFALLGAMRLLNGYLGADTERRLRDELFYPMAENLKSIGSPLTNIGLWHSVSIAAIAMRFRDEALLAYALDNPQGLRATLREGLTEDDIWREGSFLYNSYVVDALSKLLLHAATEGVGLQRFDVEARAMERLVTGPWKFRFDDGQLPTPGDGNSGRKAVDTGLLAQVYRVLPTSFGLQAAASRPTWDALIDPPTTPASPTPLPAVVTRNFPSVRMAVLKTGDWQAFIHYGQAVGNHAQEEALAYELRHKSTIVVTDAGTVAYGSPLHRDYFSRGAGNNVPLIDGLGQQGWAPGVLSSFDEGAHRLVAAQPSYRNDVAVERRYELNSEGFREATTLTSQSAAVPARRLGVALHTPCAVEPLAGLRRQQQPTAPPSSSATSYWKRASGFDADTTWSVRMRCAGQDLVLEVTAGDRQRVYVATSPATPVPAEGTVLYYETVGRSAKFELAIRPAR